MTQTMWTIFQVAVCVVFLLIAAFWIGKKIGQRRFYKVQEEMKSLELYFKHLMEDMEMVANHNMKVLESSTSELKELLEVADKKCFFATDLLKEIDEGIEGIRRRNLSSPTGVTSIDSAGDKKFRKEVHVALEQLLTKLVKLAARVEELEGESAEKISSPAVNELFELVKVEVARQLNSSRQEKERVDEAAGLSARNIDRNMDRTNERHAERVIPLKPARETFANGVAAGEKSVAVLRPATIAELNAAVIDEKVRIPSAIKKTDLEKAAPLPPLGFPVKEVLELFSQGVTLPQIARSLNMGKGEIELILKIYGESVKMRKIM